MLGLKRISLFSDEFNGRRTESHMKIAYIISFFTQSQSEPQECILHQNAATKKMLWVVMKICNSHTLIRKIRSKCKTQFQSWQLIVQVMCQVKKVFSKHQSFSYLRHATSTGHCITFTLLFK